MKNKTENKMMKEVEMIAKGYNGKAEYYKRIMNIGGVDDAQILHLIKVLDIPSRTGIDISGLMFARRNNEDYQKYKGMLVKSREFVDTDQKTRIDLSNKAVYLRELETEDINRLLYGYYMAICAAMLCMFMQKVYKCFKKT